MVLDIPSQYIHCCVILLCEVFNNNIILFLEPEWAIDSEAMKARGIIVQFGKIQLVGKKY